MSKRQETELTRDNSTEVWDGKRLVRVRLCDNARANIETRCGRGIGIRQCGSNTVEFDVILDYDGNGIDTEHLQLCSSCLAELKKEEKEARRYGYQVSAKRAPKR